MTDILSDESSDCCSFAWDTDDLGYDSDTCPDIGNKRKAMLAMRKFKDKEDSSDSDEPEVVKKTVKDVIKEIFPKCEAIIKSGVHKGEKCGKIKCRRHKNDTGK